MIPVIDIFAGPGGLGEGFAALKDSRGRPVFELALSIEMDSWAYQTLLLRNFLHRFRPGSPPADYYSFVRGDDKLRSVNSLLEKHPRIAKRARYSTWRAVLGEVPPDDVDNRISKVLGPELRRKPWVLVGGPPCQAYSVVGRSRMLAERGAEFYADKRHTLYQEYLRLLAVHAPTVFILENVKGLLSSTVGKGGRRIFEQILADLRKPPRSGLRYRLFALAVYDRSTKEPCLAKESDNPSDFVVRMERHGVPQNRHRIIVCGVLENEISLESPRALDCRIDRVTCKQAISGLPRLRSGISGKDDSYGNWSSVLRELRTAGWFEAARKNGFSDVASEICLTLNKLRAPRCDRGGTFVEWDIDAECHRDWYLDSRLEGASNHEARSHMPGDLHRYLFLASYGRVRGASPLLDDFPKELLPRHKNVGQALTQGLFNDRFRVQLAKFPATTITSHISKDGHYFIHYDPSQCRSLSVREAARLQTFPDNYYFVGPRTEQYRQVGNAVPPLMAREIAGIVAGLLNEKPTR